VTNNVQYKENISGLLVVCL